MQPLGLLFRFVLAKRRQNEKTIKRQRTTFAPKFKSYSLPSGLILLQTESVAGAADNQDNEQQGAHPWRVFGSLTNEQQRVHPWRVFGSLTNEQQDSHLLRVFGSPDKEKQRAHHHGNSINKQMDHCSIL
jgi:hypothetical protein